MDLFFREPTDKTPLIIFDPEQGKFEIIGVSVPENGKEFYQPALEWLGKFIAGAPEEMDFVINLDYFNISSSKMILFVFYKLMEIRQQGKKVNVIWFYNDEDLYEAGEDYEYITKLNFEFKKVSKSYLVN
ncbi:MAG: DUF1987 domain-containing protein [Bacteroidia bacterium]